MSLLGIEKEGKRGFSFNDEVLYLSGGFSDKGEYDKFFFKELLLQITPSDPTSHLFLLQFFFEDTKLLKTLKYFFDRTDVHT